ncbi:MAG: RepB family DNA primase, partial [Acidobacteriota bacterium]|nr:RepB family DNA primase [Acidobacteriota bacterium]
MTEPLAASSPSSTNRTLEQIRRQLETLGSPRYDVRVQDGRTGALLHARDNLSPEQVLESSRWLQHLNANGAEILFRPTGRTAISHLAEVSGRDLRAARGAGFEPAAVVRLPSGKREVWLRSPEPLDTLERPALERSLADTFRGQPTASDGGFGHLAGFTVRARERGEDPPAQPRYVELEDATGISYSEGAPLLAAVRSRLQEEALARATDREVVQVASLTGPLLARLEAEHPD